MYHSNQALVTLSKIASRSSACATRGLMKVHNQLKTYGTKGSIIGWRNKGIQTHFFTKTPVRKSLKATSSVLVPLIGSTITDGGLSTCKPHGLFGLGRMTGLKGGGGSASLFQQNACFIRVNPPIDQIPWVSAIHESGHVLVAYYTKDARQACKVTIIPTEEPGESANFMPCAGHLTKAHALAELDLSMGGRAAEIIFGPEKVSRGAQQDLKEATLLGTRMVKQWGMSEKIGLHVHKEMTPDMAELADQEIQRLLQESYERAKKICREHQPELRLLADTLMKCGTS